MKPKLLAKQFLRIAAIALSAGVMAFHLAACQPAPVDVPAATPAAAALQNTVSPAPMVTPTPIPAATPAAVDEAARQAADAAARKAYIDQCVFTTTTELVQSTQDVNGKQISISACVQRVFPDDNAVLVYDQNSAFLQVYVTFAEPSMPDTLQIGQYAILYGTFEGVDADYPRDDVNAYVCKMNAAAIRTFDADEALIDASISEEFLQGTWMMDPDGKTHFGYEYLFEGDHLLLNDYIYNKLATVFDGKYTLSRPGRVHHRYTVTSYDMETGALLGEWTGKLNHDITIITHDVIKIGGGMYYRVGAV